MRQDLPLGAGVGEDPSVVRSSWQSRPLFPSMALPAAAAGASDFY